MAVHVHVTYGRGSLSRHYMCTRTETERERGLHLQRLQIRARVARFSEAEGKGDVLLFDDATVRDSAMRDGARSDGGAEAAEHGYATAATGLPAGGVVRISLSLFKAAFLADCCGSVCRVTGSHLFGEFQLINRSMFQ